MVNSLSKRLTYRIMAVVFAMMVALAGVVYFSVREFMLDEAQDRYLGMLLKTSEEFQQRLSDIYVAAKNNVHDIERDIDDPDMMYVHMDRIIRNNTGVKSCAILFKPDYYPNKQKTFIPMVRRDSADRIYIAKTDTVYGYYRTKWYRECMESDSGLWVGTLYDVKNIPDVRRWTMLTTYSTPVHNRQGTPVGLLCLQLSLKTMRHDFMQDIRNVNERFEKGLKHHSYCFVINRDGTYILHPDEKRTLNSSFLEQTKETADTLDDRVVARMVKGENGEAMMVVDGVPSWIYYRTIKDVDWTIVIVVPEETIFHNGRTLNTIILLMMLLGMAVIYFICHRMIHQMTDPLHRFALSADQVALGNFSSPLPDIKGGDEVRLLHDAFKNMQTSLAVFVDELQKTTTSKASLERELMIAHDIQMSMLPKTFPPYPDRTEIDIYASETPARDVGGDLYDYFLRDNRLFFCIGDVSGKGMPAALLMAVMRAMFRSETRRADKSATIVDTINRNLSEEYTAGYFVTMFVGILDLATGHLDYCNAGHEAPLVTGQPLPIKPNLPVGALSDWNYEGQQAQLQSGDMLFLYTDGLSEAKDYSGKQLGRRRVQELANEYRGDTAQQLIQQMKEEVLHHAADVAQSDDITLLAIKWNQKAVPLILHPTMEEIGLLQPYIEQSTRQAGISPKESKRLRLAAEEAVVNVIHYGHATLIAIKTAIMDGLLEVTIDDDGIPFDPTAGSNTDLSLSPDQRPPGGMGIILLHTMTDGLSYRRTDGHNILTLKKKI